MNKYNPLLEEVIYAFQEEKIVSIISEICGLQDILPDKNLYAGGISLMKKIIFYNRILIIHMIKIENFGGF